MGWQDELAAAIAAMKDEDWEQETVVPAWPEILPYGFVRRTKSFRFAVEGRADWRMAGSVNALGIAGLDAGCVMLAQVDEDWSNDAPPKCWIRVVVSSRPWNMILNREGTWVEALDAKGQLLYPELDMSAIR